MSKNKQNMSGGKARDQKFTDKQSKRANLRESLNQEEVSIEVKGPTNIANRMINVFSSSGHGKPIAPEAERDTNQKNPDSILSQYLFKENTKKEKPADPKETKKKSGMDKLTDHLD